MAKLNDFIKTAFVRCSPLLLILIALWYAATSVNATSIATSNAYPKAVISYGLAGAKTDDEITATVELWKRDHWGAQIGALRVLCDADRAYVDQLGGTTVGARLCRTVK